MKPQPSKPALTPTPSKLGVKHVLVTQSLADLSPDAVQRLKALYPDEDAQKVVSGNAVKLAYTPRT